jgi:cell division septation protein DedD
MTAATDSVVIPPEEEDVTTALYRAAIGQVSNDYYLPIFTRFEAADRAGISWNTAAALSTLNWLAFRQLWGVALAYAGALVALLLLVFGIGRLIFQLSDTLINALLLGFGLAAFVLPGLFANAVLHTECRKRMAKALVAHSNVAEACADLTRQASTRRRGLWLVATNMVLLLAAVFSYWQFSALSTLTVMPQGALDAGHVSVGRTVDQPPAAPHSPPSTPTLPVSAPPLAVVPAPAQPASSAASSAVAEQAATPAPAGTAALQGASSPYPITATGTGTPAVPVAPKPAASASGKASAVPGVTGANPATTTVKRSPAAPIATASKAAAEKISVSDHPVAVKPYFINVGLFAKPENAAKAHAKLMNAKLPSSTRELKTPKGPLTRVRVGPLATEADAKAAVEQIKALQLDAIIIQP